MRARNGFSHLSGFIFLTYLVFGLGGGLLFACCSTPPQATPCSSGIHLEEEALCLIPLEKTSRHPDPCLDHCQSPGADQTYLSVRQITPRNIQSWSPTADLSLRPQNMQADSAGFFLVHPLFAQNSVLQGLRTVVLLI